MSWTRSTNLKSNLIIAYERLIDDVESMKNERRIKINNDHRQ